TCSARELGLHAGIAGETRPSRVTDRAQHAARHLVLKLVKEGDCGYERVAKKSGWAAYGLGDPHGTHLLRSGDCSHGRRGRVRVGAAVDGRDRTCCSVWVR